MNSWASQHYTLQQLINTLTQRERERPNYWRDKIVEIVSTKVVINAAKLPLCMIFNCSTVCVNCKRIEFIFECFVIFTLKAEINERYTQR